VFERVRDTAVWRAVEGLPEALAATISDVDGLDAAAAALARPDVHRILVTGNGASYYAGLATWLASLETSANVQCVPSGLLRRIEARPGDAVLAVSVSGEFRDLVEAVADDLLPRPLVAVTAGPGSTLGAHADAVARLRIGDVGTETHPQDFCTATVACLSILARLTGDTELRGLVESSPERVRATTAAVESWLPELAPPAAAVVAGHGPAWAGALELALLLKEIARIPAEGLETREAATSALTGLRPDCLVVALESDGDPFLAEAERLWSTAGSEILRIPFGRGTDPRVVPVTSFPAGAALAIALAHAAGLDPDHPWWVEHYLSTARVSHL
jgi:fructoselysine-6-P-deglycase FrlB-like protein